MGSSKNDDLKLKESKSEFSIGYEQSEPVLIPESFKKRFDWDDALEEVDNDNEPYLVHSTNEDVTFVEFAIINGFLQDCVKGKSDLIKIIGYGTVDAIGRIYYKGTLDITGSYWYNVKIDGHEGELYLQTKMFVDSRGDLISQFHVSSKKAILEDSLDDLVDKLVKMAFNNSEFKGKCIKIKLRENRFRGIEIIDIEDSGNELILNAVQEKYIKHFISRVGKGGNARYLLNGEPGTGKTECIREVARKLIPNVTFIIPDFVSSNDLTTIMEACEIFDSAVIIMDDIDLYLGSRDNGSYTRLLGEFLSFFDGVKKRKISLIASTNDKGLVDKAAERPGRFNLTIDYTFLDPSQIVKVCNIHLDEKWRIEEVYEALQGRINGKVVKITGAFIANLADNIREMAEDDEEWSVKDTISLIEESYKGFYTTQVDKEKTSMGFGANLT